jgi:hypothetical protein
MPILQSSVIRAAPGAGHPELPEAGIWFDAGAITIREKTAYESFY